MSLDEKIFWIDSGYSRGGIQTKRHNLKTRTKNSYKNKGRIMTKDIKQSIKELKEKQDKKIEQIEKEYKLLMKILKCSNTSILGFLKELKEIPNKVFGKGLI